MCGRYRLTNAERYSDLNDVRLGGNPFSPRFNIAPTQKVFVILDEKPEEFSEVRWGLIPSWAKDRKIASSLINARCETVATKPAFRTAFKKRRRLPQSLAPRKERHEARPARDHRPRTHEAARPALHRPESHARGR